MYIEQALATREAARLLRLGYSKDSVITQVTKLIKSQGFSADHSRQTAVWAVEQV